MLLKLLIELILKDQPLTNCTKKKYWYYKCLILILLQSRNFYFVTKNFKHFIYLSEIYLINLFETKQNSKLTKYLKKEQKT